MSHPPVTELTPLSELGGATYRAALEVVANMAFDHNVAMVALGVDAEGRAWVCADGCCTGGHGVVIVIPDVIAVQMALAGQNDCDGAWRMARGDGRTAYLFGAVRNAETLNALRPGGEAP